MRKSFLTPRPMPLKLPQGVISKNQQKQQVIWLEIRLKKIKRAVSTHKDPKKSAQLTEMHQEICVY